MMQLKRLTLARRLRTHNGRNLIVRTDVLQAPLNNPVPKPIPVKVRLSESQYTLVWRYRQEFLRVVDDLYFFGGKSPLTRTMSSMVLHMLRRCAREDRLTMVNAKKSSWSPSPTTFCKVTLGCSVYLGRVLPHTMMVVQEMYSALVRMRGEA